MSNCKICCALSIVLSTLWSEKDEILNTAISIVVLFTLSMCFYWVLAWFYLHTAVMSMLFWVISYIYMISFLISGLFVIIMVYQQITHVFQQANVKCKKLIFKRNKND